MRDVCVCGCCLEGMKNPVEHAAKPLAHRFGEEEGARCAGELRREIVQPSTSARPAPWALLGFPTEGTLRVQRFDWSQEYALLSQLSQ